MKCDVSNVVVVILYVIGISFVERINFNCVCVFVKCWLLKLFDLYILLLDYEFIEKMLYN